MAENPRPEGYLPCGAFSNSDRSMSVGFTFQFQQETLFKTQFSSGMLQTHDTYGIFLNETEYSTKGKVNVARLFYPWEFKKINMISCYLILTVNIKFILRWSKFSRILPKSAICKSYKHICMCQFICQCICWASLLDQSG